MFRAIQHRLLLSYLGVFTVILSMFAIAVRLTFARSLTTQLTEKLTALGRGAVASVESEQGDLQFDDFSTQDLISHKQALQWFGVQGQTLHQQGEYLLTLPLSRNQSVQIEQGKTQIQGVTLPVIDDDTGQLLGYVRVSQSLEELDDILERLDWKLGGGIVAALVFSSLGGIWLTRQAMQPIEQSFQRLQQFTADASHELRNPLMAIKSNAAVALKYREGIRDADAEKFQAIANATNQMTHLTEDLLMLARADRAVNRVRERVNLTAVLRRLIQLYQPEAEIKQIRLEADLPKSFYLLGDAGQLTQLFTNLLTNALHYTLANGTIKVQISRKGTNLVVNVQDTGIGISPEQIERIFDRFWQADQSRSYWSGGSGLGLAIAQSIAQSHNGSITVSSQLGIGSCFIVRLPATSSPVA